jgi:hypothetical protein
MVAVHTPQTIYANAGFDDGLFMTLGQNLAEGKWLGSYSQFTLMKGPGYPVFLALNNWLGIPESLACALFHCAAVTFFVAVAHRFIKSLLLSGVLFALLLWHPFALIETRIVREQIYYGQVLIFLAAAAFALFCARGARQTMLFAALAGAVLGWLWLTREEGIWLVPGIALLAAAATLAAWRERRLLELGRASLVLISVFAATQVAFSAVNWMAYGKFVGVDFKEANFQRALRALDSVRSGGVKPFVSVTREARKQIYEVSPTFAALAPYFDGPADLGWAKVTCDAMPPSCGEIGGGWFMWALRGAAEAAGHYASPAEASGFFGQIADEISAACARGALQCAPQLVAEMPPVSWGQVVSALPQRSLDAVNLLLLLDPPSGIGQSAGGEDLLRKALRFLNYPLYASPMEAFATSYTLHGWYHKSGGEWLSFDLGHSDGSPAALQIQRRFSPDLAEYFKDPMAFLQRFTITIPFCDDQCVLHLQTTEGDKTDVKLAALKPGPVAIALGAGTFYDESLEPRNNPESIRTPIEKLAADIRGAVLSNYKFVLVPVLFLGIIGFFANSVFYTKNAINSTCYTMALLSLLLVVTRVALLILIATTSFPALYSLYIGPAYFMLVCAATFSLAAWLQLAGWGPPIGETEARQLVTDRPALDIRSTLMRIRYSLGAAAAVALIVLIVALLPWSGGNVASSLWTALGRGEGSHHTLEQVSARLAQREGGFVDKMSFADGKVLVEGWAADTVAKQPALSVQIFVNGRYAGAFAPTFERPDVSKFLGISESLPFGFKASAAAKTNDAIRAFAEQRDGSFVELHYPPAG